MRPGPGGGSCATLLLLLVMHSASEAVDNEGPVLMVEGFYQGEVVEHGGLVTVTPSIKAEHGPICGYRIVNNNKGKIPFEVFMVDQKEGSAQLRTREPLNCEVQKNYTINIAAVGCDGKVSKSAEVHVTVTDVNEYIPEWTEQEYSGQVEEGEPSSQPILTVTATDRDCSVTFGSICQYSITSPDQPFHVDKHGVISSTGPLFSQESRSHVISVVATDCGGKESSPVLVTITVLPKCHTAWTDVSTSMTYIPGTGPQPVFPTAHLTLCPTVCPAAHLESSLTLHTDHVGVGCDRDTYSLASQRKMCGASSQAVDLLPAQGEGTEWLSGLRSDQGKEAGPVYSFNGQGGVIIPESVLSHELGPQFTVATWLKHEARLDKHGKEQILCLSDDHRKNRHHTSLFIRNCKLVLLMRRDYQEEERNIFKPAEWRWSIPQVCDDRWHHYAVTVTPEGVELTLDGEFWQPEANNPEVIDDWPLHPAADIQKTLTVGACWHGSDMKMKHSLRGYLAGLSVLPGKREHSEVLKCLVQCSESLQLPATNLLEPGMEMVTNSHGSQVTIDGEDATNMDQLVRQVAYLNTREFPAPGRRRLELSTTITCKDGTKRKVPTAVSGILVLSVPQPTITITGTENISREYESFKRGVRIFSDVRISVSRTGGSTTEYGEPMVGASLDRLDKCSISVFPPLNPDHEEIMLPDLMIRSLNLRSEISKTGAEVKGADMIYNFEQVVRQVIYTNQKPAYYLNRQFKIFCSELNERFTSNEFVQTLTVVHPPAAESVEIIQANHHKVSLHTAELPDVMSPLSSHSEFISQSTQGHAVVVLVVVCVGLLTTLLTVGVLRLRAAHKRSLREEAEVEMAWDDAALNITVNPLEDSVQCRSTGRVKVVESDHEPDSSDDEMYAEESSDDDDEDEAPTRHRLEWDNDL